MDFNIDFDAMIKNVENVQGPLDNKFGPDPRFWKISRNDKEQGLAVIRLLPNIVNENGKEQTIPFVRVFRHNVNLKEWGVKRFYDEESPYSIGEKCAVSDLYNELGKVGTDEAKKLQKAIRRSTKFITNIYVKKDPIKPDNDGQFKLWEFGVKLKDKFQLAAKPSSEEIALGATPVNVWDPRTGADIKLVQKKSGGFFNYDDTQIMAPSPIKEFSSGDELYKWLKDNTTDISEWLQKDHYMSHEQQCDKLRKIFEGSELEDYLKSIGSFLYGRKSSSTSINVVSETPSVGQNVSQNIDQTSTNSQNQQEVSPVQNVVEDEDSLSFLDDI